MSRLKVELDEPEHGWIGLTIQEDGEERIRCSASHIVDSLEQLVGALRSTIDSCVESRVLWLEEPRELEMVFARRGDEVELRLASYSDHRHLREGRGEPLTFRGTSDAICLPFWRALRGLQGKYSEAEFHERWKRPFPVRELDALTHALGKAK
ncbi:MAG: hypothetical protein JWP97_5184 [Labilithrix sp.]|nr:hypothetical protein [Labilithrix sp.]